MGELLKVPPEKLKWISIDFTLEEDLCLLSCDGNLYFVDPKSGELISKVSLGLEFSTP